MSGIEKTDLDCRRQEKAKAVVAALHADNVYGIDVNAGRRSGPYMVAMNRLNEREMRAVVKLLAGFVKGRWGR